MKSWIRLGPAIRPPGPWYLVIILSPSSNILGTASRQINVLISSENCSEHNFQVNKRQCRLLLGNYETSYSKSWSTESHNHTEIYRPFMSYRELRNKPFVQSYIGTAALHEDKSRKCFLQHRFRDAVQFCSPSILSLGEQPPLRQTDIKRPLGIAKWSLHRVT